MFMIFFQVIQNARVLLERYNVLFSRVYKYFMTLFNIYKLLAVVYS